MKKVCIKGNEFNTNYHLVYSEEKAIQNGYSVFEVPEGYEDCCREDFDNNGFNIELYNNRKSKEQNKITLRELEDWFDNYFDKQLNQSLWQDDFTVSHDEYFNVDYTNIDELKQKAKEIRNKIRKLRGE